MSSRWAVIFLAALVGCTRQSAQPEQANVAAPAAAPAQVAPGQVDRSHKGSLLPEATITGLDGNPAPLAPGKPRLVNLWATWCAPCVAEMPTLDRAARNLTGRLEVVVLNQGDDAAKVQQFFRDKPVTHARPLLDRAMAVSQKLGANLPTTILYDAKGQEVWRVTGGRDWTDVESTRLLGEAG